MAQRLLEPNQQKSSRFNSQSFSTKAASQKSQFQTSDFQGSKSAPVKSFSSKSFLGLSMFGSKDKQFATSAANPAKKGVIPGGSDKTYTSGKTYDASRGYISSKPVSKQGDKGFVTHTADVPGATSKKQLDAEGKALWDKVEKGEMTIDEVRDMLNKYK